MVQHQDNILEPANPVSIHVITNKNEELGGWKTIGLFLAIIFAINCGITNAIGMLVLTGYTSTFLVIAVILAISTVFANIVMCNKSIPSVLHELSNKCKNFFSQFWFFLRAKFKNGFKNSPNESQASETLLSKSAPSHVWFKRFVLGFGIFCSFCFGVVSAAVTYGTAFKLVAAGLMALSAACPPVAIGISAFLAGVSFICMSALMISGFIKLVNTENFSIKASNMFWNLVSYQRNKDINPHLSKPRFYLQLGVRILALLALSGLLGVALITSSSTSTSYFSTLLKSTISASDAVIFAICNVVGMGFALVSQIPFMVVNNILPLIDYFQNKPNKDKRQAKENDRPGTFCQKVQTEALREGKIFLRLNSAIGNGLLSMNGRVTLTTIAGFIGNFISNYNSSTDSKSNDTEQQSTAIALGRLQSDRLSINNPISQEQITHHNQNANDFNQSAVTPLVPRGGDLVILPAISEEDSQDRSYQVVSR